MLLSLPFWFEVPGRPGWPNRKPLVAPTVERPISRQEPAACRFDKMVPHLQWRLSLPGASSSELLVAALELKTGSGQVDMPRS